MALSIIDDNTRKVPGLKYAPRVAYQTFSSLLKTNTQQAYEYGKIAMITPTYEEAAFNSIIDVLITLSDKIDLPAKIYLLGAEASQLKIDEIPYPEIANMHWYYRQMAEWYWIAGDKFNAIAAQQKAVEACKNITNLSATEMKTYEDCLEQYKTL